MTTLRYSHVCPDGSPEFFLPDEGPKGAPLGRAARDVFVTGSFCGWRTPGVAMRRVEGGWSAHVASEGEGDVAYKFVVDGRWLADPTVLARDGGHDDANSVLRRGGSRGTTLHLRVDAPTLGERRGLAVYLPPGCGARGRRHPVLYLLHGALDWERTWLDKGGLASTLDALRADGAIGDLIVVMPFENGALHRGDTRVADYLARDVVEQIDGAFPTLAGPRHRALDGLSTGGFTSIVVGAWRPRVFGSVGSMSGSHDDRSHAAIDACSSDMRAAGQRFVVSGGLDEPHLGACRRVADSLAASGLETRWLEAPGGHDWPLWRALLGGHVTHHWCGLAS